MIQAIPIAVSTQRKIIPGKRVPQLLFGLEQRGCAVDLRLFHEPEHPGTAPGIVARLQTVAGRRHATQGGFLQSFDAGPMIAAVRTVR